MDSYPKNSYRIATQNDAEPGKCHNKNFRHWYQQKQTTTTSSKTQDVRITTEVDVKPSCNITQRKAV